MAEPILVSLDAGILKCVFDDIVSSGNKMHQGVRDAYALVDHKYHDAMFLGGINTRDMADNPEREPRTIWILFPDEYAEFKAKDERVVLKALSLIRCE
ncbi:hypothetical protein BH11PAT3_BH11PAT3_0240 [soil metagenome]